MTVLAAIAAIQVVNATIVGVEGAPTERPGSLNGVDLPIVLVNVGAGEFSPHAVGLPRHFGTYELLFFVAPIAQGEGTDEGWQTAVTLFDAAILVWNVDSPIASSIVEQVGDVRNHGMRSHSPIGKLTYAGIDYWGFTFTLPVQEK